MTRDEVDKVLAVWGQRLLHPRRRSQGRPGVDHRSRQGEAPVGQGLRAKLRALVRRAPEVHVRLNGSSRGMKPIRERLLYMSRDGALEVETERGQKCLGRAAVERLLEEWRFAGAKIPSVSHRGEALTIVCVVYSDVDAADLHWAARELARTEFPLHRFATVLHDPQTDARTTWSHVHLLVRVQGRDGTRLHPHMTDLERWREVFADRLTERGYAASATRRQVRGELQTPKSYGEHRAQRLERKAWALRPSERAAATESEVLTCWYEIASALAQSEDADDRVFAREALDFVRSMPSVARRMAQLERAAPRTAPVAQPVVLESEPRVQGDVPGPSRDREKERSLSR